MRTPPGAALCRYAGASAPKPLKALPNAPKPLPNALSFGRGGRGDEVGPSRRQSHPLC